MGLEQDNRLDLSRVAQAQTILEQPLVLAQKKVLEMILTACGGSTQEREISYADSRLPGGGVSLSFNRDSNGGYFVHAQSPGALDRIFLFDKNGKLTESESIGRDGKPDVKDSPPATRQAYEFIQNARQQMLQDLTTTPECIG